MDLVGFRRAFNMPSRRLAFSDVLLFLEVEAKAHRN